MNSNSNWQFPPSNKGVDVVNDPSSAHFSDDPVSKLVREVIQNSLDAKESGLTTPVVVRFTETIIRRGLIGAPELKRHLVACRNRSKDEKWFQIRDAYQRALDTLRPRQIRCLKIVDSGTTGLNGAKWDALVFQEGAVQKSGGAPGGSYGIGKNAVFNLSDLQTVFYCTRYLDGRKGRVEKFQGKATLMTHPDPHNESRDLQHIGFFRSSNGEPIFTTQIHKFFRLDEPGTGVFIIGFNPRSQNWADEITSAVIENFFYAIHYKMLVVEIETDEGSKINISHETLDHLFSQSKRSDSYHYYKSISDKKVLQTPEIDKIGVIDVHLAIGSGPRRIAYVNRNGMLITDSREQKINPIAPRGKSLWPDYAVVVIPATDEGDRWVRTMENPSHDSVSPGQLLEPKNQQFARRIFKESRDAIRSIIDDAAQVAKYGDTTNLDELASVFPEFDPSVPGNVGLEIRPVTPRRSQAPISLYVENNDDGGNSGGNGGDNDGGNGGDNDGGNGGDNDGGNGGDNDGGNGNGNSSGDGSGSGDGSSSSGGGGSGGGNGNGDGSRRRSGDHRRPIRLRNVRIVTVGPREAVIAFTAVEDSPRQISLSLVPAGEERGRESRIEITGATILNSKNQEVNLGNGVVSLTPVTNERVIVRVGTGDSIEGMAFTLGVRQ